MRTFVIGDIHGHHHALVECLQACHFDREVDRLIVLGDVCDRGSDVRECFDELLRIKHCVYVVGNHDVMALQWTLTGEQDSIWIEQGGRLTLLSYGGQPMPAEHVDLINRGYWYFEDDGRIFVHAGFDPWKSLDRQDLDVLTWDRDLVGSAWAAQQEGRPWSVPGFEDVFVGHTPTTMLGRTVPIQISNLWMLDTGAGYGRMLTVMDVQTKEFWQARALE